MAKPKLAKIPDLPSTIRHNVVNGGRTHRITLSRRFTGDKEETKNFRTFAAACDFVKQQVEAKTSVTALGLTTDQLAAARTAFTKLKGIPLERAIDFYFTHGPGGREELKLSEGRDRYLLFLGSLERKERYINAQRVSVDLMIREMGDMPLTNYTPNRIVDWLSDIKVKRKWSEINLGNYYRDYKMLFGFFARRSLIGVNPLLNPVFDHLHKGLTRRLKSRSIEIYSIRDCLRLLHIAALNPSLDLLAWFSVGLFSGIRVEEMKQLRWDNFNFRDGRINVTSEIAAKGGRPRTVPITPVLLAWLDKVESNNGVSPMQVWVERISRKRGVFFDATDYRNRIDKLHNLAGVPKKRNGLRHTFASYHYAFYEDAELTRKHLGHDCDEVLFKHYATTVSKESARLFWELLYPQDYTKEELARIEERQCLEGNEETLSKEQTQTQRKRNHLIPLIPKGDGGFRDDVVDMGDEWDFTESLGLKKLTKAENEGTKGPTSGEARKTRPRHRTAK